MSILQSALRAVYPPTCLVCDKPVDSVHGLCGPCWRDTPFISGSVCDLCGVPLLGEDSDVALTCDDCMTVARPWQKGRAALVYDQNARNLVLAFKHGDRTELALAAAGWMARAGRNLLAPDALVVPIPLHWMRLVRRRYNQAALLSNAIARQAGLQCCPDLLVRDRATPTQEGKGRDARFANLDCAIRVHPGRKKQLAGREIVLVDDVMTSGATFAAASDACLTAGAARVSVLSLARVVKSA